METLFLLCVFHVAQQYFYEYTQTTGLLLPVCHSFHQTLFKERILFLVLKIKLEIELELNKSVHKQ